MYQYVVKDYQKGFELDQVRIGRTVAENWIWPYAFDLEGLLNVHSQPHFDPSTWLYCFLADEMVGYMFYQIAPIGDGDVPKAYLDFPRTMPGHERVAELLMARAFEKLQESDVSCVEGRVTTMCPRDVQLAETVGFTMRDWGYKLYYAYEVKWGKLGIPEDRAEEIDPEYDLDECARNAARWYKRPPEWCRSHLCEWYEAGIIAHVGVRDQGRLVASCLVAPNDVRPSTAGIFYIYAPDQDQLKPMLARVVTNCVDYGSHNLIADLVGEHRQYESTYQELGFRKAAEWARCTKFLTTGDYVK